MAHRVATDEICVQRGYGEIPIKLQAGARQSLRLLSFGSKRPCLPSMFVQLWQFLRVVRHINVETFVIR